MAEEAKSEKIDPSAPLEGKNLEAAKVAIKAAIEQADIAIYQTANQLPTWLERQMQGMEDTLSLGVFRETRSRILKSYVWNRDNWEVFKNSYAWPAVSGLVDGKPMTQTQAIAVLKGIQSNVKSVQRSIELVEEYAKGTVIWKSSSAAFGGILQAFAQIGQTLGKLVEAIAALGGGAADTGKIVGGLLPWIIGALLLGPLLLRSFAAYRKGGAGAAADAAAGELEAGRAAAGRGVRAAWEGTKSLAKRAASGGVLKGAPKRHRRRRPARA